MWRTADNYKLSGESLNADRESMNMENETISFVSDSGSDTVKLFSLPSRTR